MTNQEIIDYVINTPNNTNPAILKQMLKDIAGSGGNVELDATLTQSGKAADAKAVGDAINQLSEEMENNKRLTSAQITALDNMFKICAYTSDATAAYAAFCAAFSTSGGSGGDDPGGANVYFADYSEWPIWGASISVINNGFSVDSPAANYNAGIVVGILQNGKYGDYKNKTLKFSCDVDGEIASGAQFPFYLNAYSDVPQASYTENSTGFVRGPYVTAAKHVEWTVTPSEATWESGTPSDTDYLGFRFYCKFAGTATITNFSIEVV